MSNIVIYKNMAEFIDDFKSKMVKLVGRGCEGVTYTDGLDAYKMYIYEYPKNEYYRKDISQIITTSDYDLPSFAFPIDLYLVQNLLMGTKSRYISGNVFKDWKNNKSIDIIRKIDFDAFIKAYYKMLEDINVLSTDGVEINDLAGNLIYDGKSLVGVDTCFYDKNTSFLLNRRLQSYNIHQLKVAVSHFFDFLIQDYPELDEYFGPKISSKTDIVSGIEKVKTIIKQGQV